MLPDITFNIADRLITTLMTLVGALTTLVTQHAAPPSTQQAAQSFLQRLITLVATIIRLDHGGTRAPRDPKPTTPVDPPSEPRSRTARTPRRPAGWLLEALPDIAPDIAADLAAILADPAFAALLDAAPTLHRALRPFLRGLGLPQLQSPSSPPPEAPPPHAPNRPTPLQTVPAAPRQASPPPHRAAQPKTHNLIKMHAQFVT